MYAMNLQNPPVAASYTPPSTSGEHKQGDAMPAYAQAAPVGMEGGQYGGAVAPPAYGGGGAAPAYGGAVAPPAYGGGGAAPAYAGAVPVQAQPAQAYAAATPVPIGGGGYMGHMGHGPPAVAAVAAVAAPAVNPLVCVCVCVCVCVGVCEEAACR